MAMNQAQFNGSYSCGLCLGYIGTGGGSGLNPVSTTSMTYAIGGTSCTVLCGAGCTLSHPAAAAAAVSDECPECPSPNIDQAVPGDGRWEINWQLMQCDVGSTNFYYSFQGV